MTGCLHSHERRERSGFKDWSGSLSDPVFKGIYLKVDEVTSQGADRQVNFFGIDAIAGVYLLSARVEVQTSCEMVRATWDDTEADFFVYIVSDENGKIRDAMLQDAFAFWSSRKGEDLDRPGYHLNTLRNVFVHDGQYVVLNQTLAPAFEGHTYLASNGRAMDIVLRAIHHTSGWGAEDSLLENCISFGNKDHIVRPSVKHQITGRRFLELYEQGFFTGKRSDIKQDDQRPAQ